MANPTTVINVAPPAPSDVDSPNLNDAWQEFKSEFEIFAEVSKLGDQPDVLKRATFLSCVGFEARKWLKGLGVNCKNLKAEEIVTKIDTITQKKITETMKDFNFWCADPNQGEGENFDKYLARVRKAAAACKFGDSQARMMESRIIIGMMDKDLQRNLLSKDLELNAVIEKCQSVESSRRNQAIMVKRNQDQATITMIKREYRYRDTGAHRSENQCRNTSFFF